MSFFDNFPYSLTLHAETVIIARKIKLEWIIQVLSSPQKIEPDAKDCQLKHALGRIGEYENRVLRVVYNETTKPWNIITVYFDRNQKNKL